MRDELELPEALEVADEVPDAIDDCERLDERDDPDEEEAVSAMEDME